MLFLSGIGLNFHRFLRRWNHENLNSVWEWRRNQEKREIESGAAPGAILGGILAHFWACLVPLWATLAEKGAPERVQKKEWKKSHASNFQVMRVMGLPALKQLPQDLNPVG